MSNEQVASKCRTLQRVMPVVGLGHFCVRFGVKIIRLTGCSSNSWLNPALLKLARLYTVLDTVGPT